ncbi:MAG: hypothetical protein ABI548_29150 [Polyangiaceae bacterium]
MRTFIFCFTSATALACVSSACSSSTDDCHKLSNCPPSGGSSGSGGDAGTGAASGSSGSSGVSGGGHGGASGSGGASAGNGNAGSSGMAGDAGAGGDVIPPCDATKSPSVEACVVSNDYAIFVAPTGKDTAVGTTTAPVKTIAKALQLAGNAKIVIACDGAYDEQVKLTSGAKLYGGFSCPGTATPWSYETGKKATVAPSARGLALSIASTTSSVVIEDFEFDAQAGVDPGESSVAGFVNTSTSVALTRVKLVAGKGVDGTNGSLAQIIPPDPATLDGQPASGSTGGPPNSKTCGAGGTTKGGVGGNGGSAASGGGLGLPDLGMGKGGVQGSCSPNGYGQDGASAAPQTPAAGATKLGSITPTGWSGTNGNDGPGGTPGQGGGGGAGKDTSGAGGGGAAGGCGGAGGTGGKAGGSSIALVVTNSTLAMTVDELVAANAGKGGSGVAGQDGLSGGNGGLPTVGGCQGGAGGKGGAGAAGGGAAGGVSVGIAYVGASAPMTDAATTITTGTAGAKGIGGVAGTNDGIAGVKQDVLQVL